MNPAGHSPPLVRTAPSKLGVALALVYLAWGTSYLAIREGVQTLPPGLFGGVRVMLAGALLLAFLAARGQLAPVSGRDLARTWLVGGLMFVGGNGLMTLALKQESMSSGLAAVLAATTPLWLALLEAFWPRGERLAPLGWAGVLLGLAGVVLIQSKGLEGPGAALAEQGPFLVLGSAVAWSLGSVLQRHRPSRTPHLTSAAWQMFLGGGSLSVLALLLGEGAQLRAECFTGRAVFTIFYLLVVSSLIGFVAFTWLLDHASAALAGTYAYVNPVVAVLVGWLVAGEAVTGRTVGGMVVILAGVALVRACGPRPPAGPLPPAPAGRTAVGAKKRKRRSNKIMAD
jgi:drug/metabolite transporter (DMT)-like permease